MNDILKNSLTAHYTFEDASNPGKDSSGNGFDAAALGTSLPAYSLTLRPCRRTGG